jgi:hypothetical protein
MKSKKCANCALVNFPGEEACKRCGRSLGTPQSPQPVQPAEPAVPPTSPSSVCMNCGTLGALKIAHKGSVGIEAALLLLAAVAACSGAVLGPLLVLLGATVFISFVVYCCWRLASRSSVCAACGSGNMIPTNSPVAQQFLESRVSKMQGSSTNDAAVI